MTGYTGGVLGVIGVRKIQPGWGVCFHCGNLWAFLTV